jgi:pimeloyl-ACP methyl ester carboxylesterase
MSAGGHGGTDGRARDAGDAAAPRVVWVPSADGVEIAVHDLGSPGDGSADVLLFSHATGFHGLVWRPMAAHLSRTFHCLAIDLRGHGVSVTPSGASLHWDEMGRDVMAVLDSEVIPPSRRVHGIGHSMGGAALVLAAAGRPQAFRSLWLYEPVVVAPGLLPPTGHPNPMAEGAARRRDTFGSLDDAVANYESKSPLNQLRGDALWSYVEGGFATRPDGQVMLRCTPATEAALFRGASDNASWGVLGELDLPVAVVAGRDDEFGPVTFAPSIVECLPQGRLIERRHLGHFGPLEDPEYMAHDLEGWIEATREE